MPNWASARYCHFAFPSSCASADTCCQSSRIARESTSPSMSPFTMRQNMRNSLSVWSIGLDSSSLANCADVSGRGCCSLFDLMTPSLA